MRTLFFMFATAIAVFSADPLAPFRPYLFPGAAVSPRPGAPDAVITADLDGDGVKETIIFYYVGACQTLTPQCKEQPSARFEVLKPKGSGYTPEWSWTDWGWGFEKPTGLLRIPGQQRPVILAYTSVGASCPGQLRLFQFRDGRFEKAYGWDDRVCATLAAVKDIDGDGTPEIAFAFGARDIPHVFRWNGHEYSDASERYPRFYDSYLKKYRESFFNPSPISIEGRWSWAQAIIEIYRLQKRPAALARFVQEAQQMLESEDRTTSEPDMAGRRSQILQELETNNHL